jgi:hypothetical protein
MLWLSLEGSTTSFPIVAGRRCASKGMELDCIVRQVYPFFCEMSGFLKVIQRSLLYVHSIRTHSASISSKSWGKHPVYEENQGCCAKNVKEKTTVQMHEPSSYSV